MGNAVAEKPSFNANPAFVQHEELLLQLHDLSLAGKDESLEAESLREKMEVLWRSLSEAEREFQNGLSADLYMIEGKEILEPASDTPDILIRNLKEAWDRNDARIFLKLLRTGYGVWSPDQVAYVRWKFYSELGHDRVAVRFLLHASKLNPNEQNYLAILPCALVQAHEIASAKLVAKSVCKDDERINPYARIMAASFLLDFEEGESRAEFKVRCEEIAETVQRALNTNIRKYGMNELPGIRALGFIILAYCYEICGHPYKAVVNLEKAAEIDGNPQQINAVIEGFRKGKNAAINPDYQEIVRQNYGKFVNEMRLAG